MIENNRYKLLLTGHKQISAEIDRVTSTGIEVKVSIIRGGNRYVAILEQAVCP